MKFSNRGKRKRERGRKKRERRKGERKEENKAKEGNTKFLRKKNKSKLHERY